MSDKINVLAVFANPRGTNPLRLGTEERVIRESIRLSRHRDNISLTTCPATTVHDLRRALLDEQFQIVHISGHGTGIGLVLEDESGGKYVVPQQGLADLFHAYTPPIKCVILNACYSIQQGQLNSMQVPFTIAMEGSISDDAAIEFSRGFYDAIGAGREIDFAYEEGCRTVNLAAPNTQFISKCLRKGEIYTAAEFNETDTAESRSGEQIHFKEVNALVGLAIDLSGSMASNIQNNTGGQISRLESFRRSIEGFANEAKSRIRESQVRSIQTSIDLFAYGFGLRTMSVCDLLSLIKIGQNVISKEEIEGLKQKYVREMESNYGGYSGLGDLARQFGLGGLARQAESAIRSNAESEIRRKIMLEVKRRLESQLQNVGDTTLPIEEIAKIWESSGETLSNAEELIFGNTPMCEGLTQVTKRFERELKKRNENTVPVLFILSDGEPTDGDPLAISETLKSLGVLIISCFVTDQDLANPRVLFGNPEPQWSAGAKLMFEMASKIEDDSAFVNFLLHKNWVVNADAKLFVQANHSTILEEFIHTVLSPFEAADVEESLPRGV